MGCQYLTRAALQADTDIVLLSAMIRTDIPTSRPAGAARCGRTRQAAQRYDHSPWTFVHVKDSAGSDAQIHDCVADQLVMRWIPHPAREGVNVAGITEKPAVFANEGYSSMRSRWIA